jgi:hypothetical protein
MASGLLDRAWQLDIFVIRITADEYPRAPTEGQFMVRRNAGFCGWTAEKRG